MKQLKPKKVSRLRSIFSSVVFSGLALFQATGAYAAGKDADAGNPPPPTPSVLHIDDDSLGATQSDRGIQDRLDNYFAHKPSVHLSHDGIWITPAERYDVHLLPLPENGLINITREYIEVKPLRTEWYGRAQGFSYGVQADIGNGVKLGPTGEWNLRTGFSFGYYDGPDRTSNANNQAGAFVEGYRDVKINGFNANLIVGTSFNHVAGPEIGNGTDSRVYSQIDFPAFFAKAKNTADKDALGTFSASFRMYAGSQTYGGLAGFYFNSLKDGGSGVNFSAGPEIKYDKQNGGVTYGFRVRVAPKIW